MMTKSSKILEEAKKLKDKYPELRLGQAFFNILYENHEDVAERLSMTGLDPFYCDFVPEVILQLVDTYLTPPSSDDKIKPSEFQKRWVEKFGPYGIPDEETIKKIQEIL